MEELSLKDIVLILWSKVWVIIGCVVLGSVATFVVSSYFINPTYQSRLSLYVFNEETKTKEASSNDLLMAQRLVNSYMAVLQSDKFLNGVIKDVGLNVGVKGLKKQLKMSAITDTELFEIVVSADSPAKAYKIASSIRKLAPSAVKQIVQAGRTEIVDIPVVAEEPSSPNVLLNTVIGALLGLVGSCMLVLLIDMLDTKIKSKDDITDRYHVPILGSIPLCMDGK